MSKRRLLPLGVAAAPSIPPGPTAATQPPVGTGDHIVVLRQGAEADAKFAHSFAGGLGTCPHERTDANHQVQSGSTTTTPTPCFIATAISPLPRPSGR
ncbi:hypothetical protein [Streptomyces sp. KR80]|uniref:hypothetical protein n=1 Tax=Streptomyces sp. KR80 TaxID=3457426 RepID=UPI003FD3FB5C